MGESRWGYWFCAPSWTRGIKGRERRGVEPVRARRRGSIEKTKFRKKKLRKKGGAVLQVAMSEMGEASQVLAGNPYKIVDHARERRKGITATSLKELSSIARSRLSIPHDAELTIVLEQDGEFGDIGTIWDIRQFGLFHDSLGCFGAFLCFEGQWDSGTRFWDTM